MPSDREMAEFCHSMLLQLELRYLDWDEIAKRHGISNGHAARMRWTRFKQQMETTMPLIRKPRKPRKPRGSGKLKPGVPDEKDRLARKRKCVSDNDEDDEPSDCGKMERKKEEKPDEKKVKLELEPVGKVELEPQPVGKVERCGSSAESSHGQEITAKKDEQGSGMKVKVEPEPETKFKFEQEPEAKFEPKYLSDDDVVIEVGQVVEYEPEEEGDTITVKYKGP